MKIEKELINIAKENNTDSAIAKAIILLKDNNKELSLKMIAKESKISASRITTFSKRLGYDGFKELKYALGKPKMINESELSKMALDLIEAIKYTDLDLEDSFLSIIASKIITANVVHIFAVGDTFTVAYDFSQKLERIGINSQSSIGGFQSRLRTENANSQDLFFIISSRGSTTKLLNDAKIALKRKIPVIALTNRPNSEMAKIATISINAKEIKPTAKHMSLWNRQVLSFVCNRIVEKIIYTEWDKAENRIKNTRYIK